ncbi:hypothetical protein [Kocuria sp. cx-455]|uniref:hypothetical protein n=1 Tax=Kocuria sp. cx-455 TaxID=2771377 RepID=UPI003D72BB3B
MSDTESCGTPAGAIDDRPPQPPIPEDVPVRIILVRPGRTALNAVASGVPHGIDAAFNDRDYGPWTGQIKDNVIREWGSVNGAPGVEDEQVVLDRALEALTALVREGSGDGTVHVPRHHGAPTMPPKGSRSSLHPETAKRPHHRQ